MKKTEEAEKWNIPFLIVIAGIATLFAFILYMAISTNINSKNIVEVRKIELIDNYKMVPGILHETLDISFIENGELKNIRSLDNKEINFIKNIKNPYVEITISQQQINNLKGGGSIKYENDNTILYLPEESFEEVMKILKAE